MIGPGKYDAECHETMRSTGAVGCVVIVIAGDRGDGFSFRTRDPELLRVLPTMLENMAADIRADAQRSAN